MITKKLSKRELANALKALNDAYIYITFMDDKQVIIKDRYTNVTIQSK